MENVHEYENLSSKIVQGNDIPSKHQDESDVKKLALHMGLPPGQVPLTLHQFTQYRTSKEKRNKWIANIRVDTGLVAYTRVITDSTRIFDRGRSLDWTRCLCWSPTTTAPAPPRGEITGVSIRNYSPLHVQQHTSCAAIAIVSFGLVTCDSILYFIIFTDMNKTLFKYKVY